MSNYDPKQAKAEYNNFYSSEDFDIHYGEKQIVDSLVSHLDLQSNDRILDVPCGTGKYSEYFAQKGMDVTGVDISNVGIQIANDRFSEPNFLVGDATRLPVQPNQYDIIFCHGFSLFNSEDINACRPFINQALDAMKPGGVLIWGKTTNLSDTDVGSRFDHSLHSLTNFFSSFEEVQSIESFATIPHLGLLLRKKSLNKPLTKIWINTAKITGWPVRAYCLVKTRRKDTSGP